jgi:hypothetical protein
MSQSRQSTPCTRILISGFPRAGTTMMLLMMKCFSECNVKSGGEYHPVLHAKVKSKGCYVIKQPFGYFEDFPPPYDYDLLINQYGYRIISMMRDPRDVLVSRHKKDLSKYWVMPMFVFRNCEEYLKHQDNPSVLFVRYEDLVNDPVKEMHRIAEFVGAVYNDGFVNFYKLRDASSKINISLNGPRPIDTNSISNWKKPGNKEYIESIMTDELKDYIVKLGYEL